MNHSGKNPRIFLTVSEVAERLGVRKQFVYRMVAGREIAHYRFGIRGRSIRIAATDLDRYIDERGGQER